MQKFLKRSIIAVMLIILSANFLYAESEPQLVSAPLSQAFLDWQANRNNVNVKSNADSDSEFHSGYIPFPVDLSYLDKDPPRESSANIFGDVKAASIPSKYDLRDVNGKKYVTSIKNQNPYGTCWAHAAIGAMESNYLINGGSALDLSEMHLAWYTFVNSDSSQAFGNMSSSQYNSVMEHGGNVGYPTAIYSRLSGPVLESLVPYPTQPSEGTPESYSRFLRLRDVYFFSRSETSDVNESETQRNIIKQRIMETGSVSANYYHVSSAYNKTSSNGTAYYTTNKSVNHAIQIIGWDDSYSRSNFKTNPGIDGAWLIKNSWGESWGTNGYFWMSYAQYLTDGAAFIVEDSDSDMNVYYYDALGWCSSSGWTGQTAQYAANVFKSTRDEKLTEVGFYAPINNLTYEIIIYDNLGTSMPSSSPVGSSAALTQSGTIAYAGYHTVDLSSAVSLTKGNYFSVIVKMYGITYIPYEKKISGYSDHATTETGSFFSYNGTSWQTGTQFGGNACVKAFTVTQTTISKPSITTSYPPDGTLNVYYSSTITASGGSITWSMSGNVPPGLSIDSSTGTISGTPTTAGSYTFTVTATNSAGSDSKNFTMNIREGSTFNTTSFSGYVGYNFSETLSLSGGESATWTANNSLPNGLKLTAKTGLISGKPTKAGTFTTSITATTSSTTITETVKFTIEAKPVKPSITTSSLKNGVVGEDYDASITVKGTDPITITAEGVPAGLTLTGTNLSGTPTTSGTYTIKFMASNTATSLAGGAPVTKNVRLIIKDHAPVIDFDDSELPDGFVGKVYDSVQFNSSAGDNITWTASGLPTGLKLSKTGLLSGTPTRAGNYNITLRAANSGGNTSKKIALKILQAPSLTTKKLNNVKVDAKYSVTLRAAGSLPITWTVTGLPDGLTITPDSDKGTAQITGNPTQVGDYEISITLNNSAGSVTNSLALSVLGTPPKISAVIKKATVDDEYNEGNITVTGTKPINITYSILNADKTKFGIDSLSDLGLSFTADSETGIAAITGTPTKSIKSLPIYINAENTTGKATRKITFTAAGVKPTFTTPEIATTKILTAAGGNINVDFVVTGTKDIILSATKLTGFSFTQTGDYTATLEGTAPLRESNSTITITAQNADGRATRRVNIITKIPPSITTKSLVDGTINKSYSTKLLATGSKTIKWQLDGDLPDGMTFSESNGQLRGKPKEAGEFNLTFTASNDVGKDNISLTLTIIDPNATEAAKEENQTQDVSSKESEQVSETDSTPDESTKPESSESTIIYGANQTLSAGTIKNFADKGFTIIAALPEIQVNSSGQYEIESIIELDESIESGKKLYWFAMPQGVEPSEDDEIVEFYDEDGQEILQVPESHKIKISAWLTEGIIYKPVICVESE
ncbi:MAG: putative Ig domain-containing protein [Synergistaceae bacterium]|nr:putative Ig domain-containing protein [Synergistaceae bacterium]